MVRLAAGFFALIGIALLTTPLSAAEDGKVTAAPAKFSFEIPAGTSRAEAVEVSNETTEALNFSVTKDSDWLKPEIAEFNLKAGEKISLPITISIPKETEPGLRRNYVYIAINKEDPTGGMFKLGSQIGITFKLTVVGNAKIPAISKERSTETSKLYALAGTVFILLFASSYLIAYTVKKMKRKNLNRGK